MKKGILSILILCVVYLTSCMKGVDEIAKQEENDRLIKEYLAANNLTPTRDTLGMYAVIRNFNPAAKKLAFGDSVKVNYEIYLLDGTKVMSNDPGKPLGYLFGYAPIYGFDLALNWMRVGERATVLLPYYFAFGSGGSSDGKIGAYSPIRVELELESSKSESDQMAEYIARKGYNVGLTTNENLNIVWLKKVEDGDSLGMGKQITVAYQGFLLSGKKFDEGALNHLTGSSGLIKGFDRGVRKMKMGEKAVIIFPSKLGYGETGTQDRTIPPFAPLAFEVEITKVN